MIISYIPQTFLAREMIISNEQIRRNATESKCSGVYGINPPLRRCWIYDPIVSVYFKVDTRLIVLENERIDRREAIARFEAKAERKFEQIDSKLDRLLEAVLFNHSQNGNGQRK